MAAMCIDHIIPRTLGGSHDLANLLPACRSCNGQKRDKTLDQYRTWLQWRLVGVEPFSNAQKLYLRSCGFDLPSLPIMEFWGEKQK